MVIDRQIIQKRHFITRKSTRAAEQLKRWDVCAMNNEWHYQYSSDNAHMVRMRHAIVWVFVFNKETHTIPELNATQYTGKHEPFWQKQKQSVLLLYIV